MWLHVPMQLPLPRPSKSSVLVPGHKPNFLAPRPYMETGGLWFFTKLWDIMDVSSGGSLACSISLGVCPRTPFAVVPISQTRHWKPGPSTAFLNSWVIKQEKLQKGYLGWRWVIWFKYGKANFATKYWLRGFTSGGGSRLMPNSHLGICSFSTNQ